MNKKAGAAADSIEMLPTIIIIVTITIVISTASSLFYNYDVNVKESEAMVLGLKLERCLTHTGVINVDDIDEAQRANLFSYCGIESTQKIYAGVTLYDSSGKEVINLKEGDSGLIYLRDLFGKVTGNAVSDNVGKMVEYNPGYYVFEIPVFIVKDSVRFSGKAKVEVIIAYEK